MKQLEAYDFSWFNDNYIVRMVLRKENGEIYREEHDNMSLTDFEVLYGNISDELIEIEIKLKREEEFFDGVMYFMDNNFNFRVLSFNDKNKDYIDKLKMSFKGTNFDFKFVLLRNTLSNKLEMRTKL